MTRSPTLKAYVSILAIIVFTAVAGSSLQGFIANQNPQGLYALAGKSPSPPGTFGILLPSNGDVTSLQPTFSWSASNGVNTYTIQIDTEISFASPLTHETAGISKDTRSYTVPSGALTSGIKYYWRVKAINSAGETAASNSPFSFSTR